MSELPLTWLAARASGIVALGLLTLSVVAGLVLKTRPFGRLVKGATAMEIHRSLSIAALASIVIHGVALVMDRFVEIRWTDLLIPFGASYRPLWTGMGVVAAELMLLIAVSFRLRKRIGVPMWRRLHYLSYATFALAVLHGIFGGTDTQHRWMQTFYVAVIALVAGATAFRVVSPAPPRPELTEGGSRRRVAPVRPGAAAPPPVAAQAEQRRTHRPQPEHSPG